MRRSKEAVSKKLYMVLLVMVSVIFIAIAMVWENKNIAAKPCFSAESGFYKDSFYLNISSGDDNTIYYTLDGSEPDENSLVYDNPIFIENATKHENIYSMITDVSTGFNRELLERYGIQHKDPQYKVPDYLVDKCTVIRAVAVSKSGTKSEETNASYFVGIAPEDYDGCKIISLITDSTNLFDSKKGIYVTGNVFEEYMKGEEIDESWRWWSANYRMKGEEWEREALFHFFDENGVPLLSQKGGIRIHGGVSRAMLPKSLNLYARYKYDGKDNFELQPFDNQYKPKRMTLSGGGNQVITLFSDYVMTECMEGVLDIPVLKNEPYALFINGEYWGFYWLNEKYDKKYLAFNYGVKEDNVILIKNDELEVGEEGQEKLFIDTVEYIVEHDMSDEGNYGKVCDMIDIDNYIDYNATLVYIARQEDWPFSNWAVWRTKNVGNNECSDGRWRWMLFDCNSRSMGNVEGLTEHNTLEFLIDASPMFASLWQNENFREKFEERILFIADECFAADKMEQFIDKYCEEMIPILSKSWKRFYGSNNTKLDEFNEIMQWQKDFYNGRKDVVESWFSRCP